LNSQYNITRATWFTSIAVHFFVLFNVFPALEVLSTDSPPV